MNNKKKKNRSRIYVCHTLYHVYVSLLKEMNRKDGKNENPVRDCTDRKGFPE